MKCNVEKAKVMINDILLENVPTVENAEKFAKINELKSKQAEQFANLLDTIKSNFELTENVANNDTVTEVPAKSKKSTGRENFDKLSSYNSENPTFVYAGIGSRETPQDVLEDMTSVSSWLESQGYKLQTGYKYKNKYGSLYEEGADKAFSSGTSNKELFGPDMSNDLARNIAKEIHPLGKGLTTAKGLDLHARNTFQVFGKNLDTPVDFVLFYAEETKSIRPKGGTGQAVQMARLKGIPAINIWNNPNWKRQVMAIVKKNQSVKNKTQENNPKENVKKQDSSQIGKESAVLGGEINIHNREENSTLPISSISDYNSTFIVDEDIEQLNENEIFVFGSNEAGIHGKGAAKKALEFGAKRKEGIGEYGKTYAIPTKDSGIKTLSLLKIKEYVDQFIIYASRNQNKTYLVTAIGTGLAGYADKDIAPMFSNISSNIKLPKKWKKILSDNSDRKKDIKGSMDGKIPNVNATVGEVKSETLNIRESLFQYVIKNKGENDFDDVEFAGNFANIGNMIIGVLDKYNLNKNIEFRQHKMATDRYTRGTYAFGDDVAQVDNNYVSGSENGYMLNIDGGIVDIYYGKGFYDETADGIVQNEIRQDISLSTNSELIMHEVLHSMIEKAYDQDKDLNRSLFLLKEQAMKQISYKDVLGKPESDATSAEIQLAKDIYSYMDNPTEFLAYAATNENVFKAVKNLTIKNVLIGKFSAKRGEEIGKFKQFLNKFIDLINNIYTTMTTTASFKVEFDRILNNLIDVNTKIETGQLDIKMEKQFKPYKAFGIGDKYQKVNEFMSETGEFAFSKARDIWSANSVRSKAESAGLFLENIMSWRGLQWLRDSRVITDLVTDMVEDTTSDDVAWFYESVRQIKGNRERDKLDFAAVMKKKVGAEFAEFSEDERSAVTFMLQGDWKALGVNLNEYKELLSDDTKLNAEIDKLKKLIGQTEYINQSAMLGYYLAQSEAKGSAVAKNAYQIYKRLHVTDGGFKALDTGIIGEDENISAIDKLSSLYAIKYTDKVVKDNIISAINRDSDVVSFGSDVYYSYREKEQSGQLGMFSKYLDKGYVRKTGLVDMKFDIVPESQLITNSRISALNHNVIREMPDVSKELEEVTGTYEKYFLVAERNMDPARTQGVLDDISVIDNGQLLTGFTAGKDFDYKTLDGITYRRRNQEKKYLNEKLDDSFEAMRNRENYGIAEYDINGKVVGYSQPISEADKINYGKIVNDIADVLGNTTSHIQSKERALLNNQSFIDLLLEDSDINVGNPGYVFLGPKVKDAELSKYWAMIPDYSRAQIMSSHNGIWVKRSRINNIVGYKDVSISNMKLFGLDLSKYPQWQRALKIVEHTWKEIASAYKEIIVKLMPDVVFGNATSNMFVAMRHGIGPMEYAKAFRSAWTDLSEYMELNEQLISLKIDSEVGKPGVNVKITELTKRLERNGMHPLIKDGQFSMIFEDLDKDLIDRKTHLKDVTSAKIEKWFGKNAADNIEEFRQNIYITKDTRGHRAIEKLTLYNDIINRKIIMDKMLQDLDGVNFANEKSREAAISDVMNYLDQLFVNYSYLTNKYVKWGSDLNIVLFIKYFLRAGKASLSQMRRQPLGSTIAESIDSFIWDMPDPIDQYMNPVDTLANKIAMSPVDMLGEIISPNIFNIFK